MKARYALFFTALVIFIIAAIRFFYHDKSIEPNGIPNYPNTSVAYSKTLIEVGSQHKLKLPITVNFVVRNTGKNNLYIQKVEPDCHCTVAKFSSDPVLPNDSTVIILKYDASNPGPFQSSSFVTTNSANSPTLLVFRGIVDIGVE